MSGFVRGGRTAQPARESVRSGESERPLLVDPVREVLLVDADTARVITDDEASVIAAEQRNPLIVHVVEPVGISAEGLGFALGDLTDLDVPSQVPDSTPLTIVLDPETHRFVLQPFTVEGANLLTTDMVGAPGGLAQLDGGGRLPMTQLPEDVATDASARVIVGAAMVEHVLDSEPHPAYDDLADLTLIFDNGLV